MSKVVAVINNDLYHHTGERTTQFSPAQQGPLFPVWPLQSKQISLALTVPTRKLYELYNSLKWHGHVSISNNFMFFFCDCDALFLSLQAADAQLVSPTPEIDVDRLFKKSVKRSQNPPG